MQIDEKIVNSKAINKIFKSKKEFHKSRANESIEKKFDAFLKLQKITFQILQSTGRDLPPGKRVWKI
ncbi:MAG TPA: hypothetical protein VHP32_04465 [Ignavibacteria bacterium]|nr:hypothetical protein [Ignavibacteria bacterium]